MRLLKLLGRLFIAFLLIIFSLPLLMPIQVDVGRSIMIHADARSVFREINSLQKWSRWSAFAWDDSTLILQFSGPETGIGNRMEWQGNRKGKQSIEIMQSEPYHLIQSKPDMHQGGKALDEWVFEQINDSIKVTWTLKLSELSYPFNRYFGFFSQGIMGPVQEEGLEKLKELCEQTSRPPAFDFVNLDELQAMGITKTILPEELETQKSVLKTNLKRYIKSPNIDDYKSSFYIITYHDTIDLIDLTVGYMVEEETKESGDLRYFIRQGGKAIKISIDDDADALENAITEINLIRQDFQKPGATTFIEIIHETQEDETEELLEMYSLFD